MTLSDLSIKNPVFAWMLMAALIIFGAISFLRMGISQLPDVDFPVIDVQVTDSGAAPEVMETEIVDVIEDAVMTVEGVKTVSSQTQDGAADITVEFELSRNIDAALQDVEAKVSQAQKLLPKEMDPPIITKTNPEDTPIVNLALYSTNPGTSQRDLMIYTSDVLKDELASVPGVGNVTLNGYLDPNLRVWVDGKALSRYQLTAADVISAIQVGHVELPSGLLETGAKNANVRTLGEADTVKKFEDIQINARGGQPNYHPIPLGRVARIEEGLADVWRIARSNGYPAVGLGLIKQRGTNAVEVAANIRKKMAQLSKTMPAGMGLGVTFDTTEFIKDSVHELNRNLVLSALATALVCWLFLGSWSSTFNILMAIPTSVVGTFSILYFAGFTLNTFTLLGLSLAIGIVVDDAIMVLENIVRHQELGKGRILAAVDGAREITFAAMATTMAIIAIFLPVAFMSGVIGKFFFQFGVTMTAAVAISLLEALTLTPMRCSQFVTISHRTTRIGRGVEAAFSASEAAYRRSLAWALRRRLGVLLAALAFFGVSMLLFTKLKKEFIPAQDQSAFTISMKTPVDSSLAYTDSKFKEAEKFLASRPEVDRYFTYVGKASGGLLNQGGGFITLKPKGQRGIDKEAGHELSQMEIMALTRKAMKKIPDLKASTLDLSTRGFTASRGYPIQVGVQGPDWDKLTGLSAQLVDELEKSGYLTDLDTDYQIGMPEVDVVPDRERATQHGVSIGSIAEVVNAMVGGELVGQYPRGGHRDDIRVRLVPDQRNKATQINGLYVRNDRGEIMPLSAVTHLETRKTLQQVNRVDRKRTVTIFANVAPGRSQTDAMAVVEKAAAKVLPQGYGIAFSGSSQTFTESFQDLTLALVLGVLVAYMVLGSQFNSFIDPVTVLMALPFSVSGAFMALWIFGLSLNIYSMIGLILLMGIVKKNSIMLVDFTNQVRAGKKMPVDEALLAASPIRFRPIMMTSFACIAAAVPEALSKGAGSETQVPMAMVVIGGIFVSTFLTLYVVPCFYSLAARFENRETQGDLLADAMKEKLVYDAKEKKLKGRAARAS